jgi:DNA repair protein RecO (recombination protein O)
VPVYKAEGIVLRRHVIGEADRTLTLFTREHGKLRAVARGSRKITSRLGGRVEPLTHGQFLLARGRSLDVVAQVEVIRAFPGIRDDLVRSGYAAYVAELVDRFLPERDRHVEVFDLVLRALAGLEHADEEQAETGTLWFALRLASDLGYRPEVDACAECGKSLPRQAGGSVAAWGFSPGVGGALCPSCAAGHAEVMRVAPGVLATCGYLLRTSLEQAGHLRVPSAQRRDLARLVQAHLEYQLDAKLRAPAVIGRLREAGSRP